MNKSKALRKAIIAVMTNSALKIDEKVDILDFLFSEYRLEKWREGPEDKEEQA